MDQLVYWIWLSLACTPDTATFPNLLTRFKNAKEVYDAEEYEIKKVVGPKSSDRKALFDKNLEKAEEIYKFCKTKGVGIITYGDEDFPDCLRTIPTPPVLLYYRGILPNFKKSFRCAIVGTRTLSDYGRRQAFVFGYDMGCAGSIVVSGMATGIDGVALAGALVAGGQTIAVLGSGIDVCYPPEHTHLARQIVKNGCVFTEYAPGTKPFKLNFPKRNRIISGLSQVTVVVEGHANSGSLITARYARKQNRPVYAFPGNVGNRGSQATNMLIKNGAKLCTDACDIVSDFEFKEGLGILNPFKIQVKPPFNLMDTLSEYKVSATTPSDDIFNPPRPKRKSEGNKPKVEKAKEVKTETVEITPENTPDFNKEQLALYKKIPLNEECTIESLVSEDCDLKKVMKLLLKLEMGCFVKMLPGDKVKRNI